MYVKKQQQHLPTSCWIIQELNTNLLNGLLYLNYWHW